MKRTLVLLIGLAGWLAGATPESYIPKFEQTLNENILKFWYPRAIDRENGGYIIRWGPKGEAMPPGPKALVTQARTVWLFARAARAGYGDRKQMLAAAEHGYRFLTTRMYDARHGGFAWETDVTGQVKTKPRIHLYGQSFALYAISEYAMASGRKDVLDFAVKFFQTLEAKSHDRQYGGYVEFFNEDWTKPADGEPSYMSGPPGVKLMNTHLHLMEAMTTFYRASKLPLARERLVELMFIESNAVVRKGLGACTDQYQRDWTPILEGAGARVSYGHDLENVWLLADAAEAAGIAVAPLLDLFDGAWRYSLKYGWDEKDGGFWYWGRFQEPATGREKSWWVQAEVLVSALTMFKLTRDPRYWEVFEKTWAFVEKHHVDREVGEWWQTVDANLRATGEKANAWKGGYHNGRAMIEGIALLKSMQGGK
jgi:mannobiose 2-epimerase